MPEQIGDAPEAKQQRGIRQYVTDDDPLNVGDRHAECRGNCWKRNVGGAVERPHRNAQADRDQRADARYGVYGAGGFGRMGQMNVRWRGLDQAGRVSYSSARSGEHTMASFV